MHTGFSSQGCWDLGRRFHMGEHKRRCWHACFFTAHILFNVATYSATGHSCHRAWLHRAGALLSGRGRALMSAVALPSSEQIRPASANTVAFFAARVVLRSHFCMTTLSTSTIGCHACALRGSLLVARLVGIGGRAIDIKAKRHTTGSLRLASAQLSGRVSGQ